MGLPLSSVIFPVRVALLVCACNPVLIRSKRKIVMNGFMSLIPAKIIFPNNKLFSMLLIVCFGLFLFCRNNKQITMASRDYLIRQIEEMGIFLALLLRRVLKMKEENQQDQMDAAVKESLFQELKLDVEQIVMLEDVDFLAVAKDHFTSENQLEKFADILMVLGKEIVSTFSLTKANYLLKALFLFNYLQNTTTSFSYERRNKILEIEELAREKGLI
jgi:hypothetical protein